MNRSKKFNENVKTLLEIKNMSVRKLAEKISVAPSTLTDSLKSKKGLPLNIAISVADVLGYTVEELSTLEIGDLTKLKKTINTEPKTKTNDEIQRLINEMKVSLSRFTDEDRKKTIRDFEDFIKFKEMQRKNRNKEE